ncbi:MAG: hypothetical protein QM756_16750 [Polyangiaceae bacterium]
MAGDNESTQAQSQQQSITISVESAGDPDLERRIFGQIHSAGRQLRNLSAVVELLLAAHGADPNFATSDEARATIETFKQMQLDILRAKSLRDPDKVISQLEALQKTDPAQFAVVTDRLKSYLAGK